MAFVSKVIGTSTSNIIAIIVLIVMLTTYYVSGIKGRNPAANPPTEGRSNSSDSTDQPADDSNGAARTKSDADLMSASTWGEIKTVADLLDAGADVNVRADNGDTPLIIAASYGRSEIVETLLEKGADVNRKNQAGNTALIEAAATGKPEIVRALLERGADLNAKNIGGYTALDVARQGKHQAVAQLLNDHRFAKKPGYFDPGLQTMHSGAELHQAIALADAERIRALIKEGVDVNARDANGWTALMSAASRGDADTTELLLANRADPNLRAYKQGHSALIIAVTQGHAKVVSALLKGGANPNGKDGLGNTAMAYAQQSGQVQIGRLLKRAGVKTPSFNQVLSAH